MTDREQAANRYVNGAKQRWDDLVHIAANTKPQDLDRVSKVLAKTANEGEKSVKQKMLAVHYALNTSTKTADFCSKEDIEKKVQEIIEQGQKLTMSVYVSQKTEKRKKESPLAVMKWMVSPDLRDAVNKEVWRIAQVLKLKTSDEFWMWWHSQAITWTNLELQHSAGMVTRDDETKQP